MPSRDPSSRPRRLAALGLGVLGLLSLAWFYLGDPPYQVPISDFGRDLLAAHAIEEGENPYQPVANLLDATGQDSGIPGIDDLWVAHSPFALAVARGLVMVAGTAIDRVANTFQVFTSVLVLVVVSVFSARRSDLWMGIAVAGALGASFAMQSDVLWLHGGAIACLGLLTVLHLSGAQRRGAALVLLALLVAWRPWLAPMALFLPSSESQWKDAAVVGGLAGITTLASLPAIGGLASLQSWFGDALPANFDLYSTFEWNQSLIGPLVPATIATLLFVGATLALAARRDRIHVDLWPVAGAVLILSLSPLVWSQYWLVLMPTLLVVRRVSLETVAFVLLLMAWPFAGSGAALARLTSLLAVGVLIAFLIRARPLTHVEERAARVQP